MAHVTNMAAAVGAYGRYEPGDFAGALAHAEWDAAQTEVDEGQDLPKDGGCLGAGGVFFGRAQIAQVCRVLDDFLEGLEFARASLCADTAIHGMTP